jgi:hypothetical protein
MARWKLVVNHYLNVEGTKWEYTETDRVTGRPKRTQFNVPRYLDIQDPGDWTNRIGDSGEIIVTNGGTHDPKDIVFTGEPTPDMEPVDDEAKKISKSLEDQWRRGADAMVSGKSYADEVADKLHAQMGELTKVAQSPPKVQIEGLDEVMRMMAQTMASLAQSNRRL